jgi:hypothetical protein
LWEDEFIDLSARVMCVLALRIIYVQLWLLNCDDRVIVVCFVLKEWCLAVIL